jgi:hypothetical protein
MTRTRSSSAPTRSSLAANGDALGQDEAAFDEWLDELLDQVAGYGVDAEGVMAALSMRINGREVWPEPRPLPGTGPVPPWPGGLGPVADAFIGAVAANTATYGDLTGFCVLAVASTVLAGSVVVQGGPDWFEPVILQLIVIARSGEGKTPPLIATMAPLNDIEMAWRAATKPKIAQAKSKKRMLEGMLQAAERAVVSKGHSDATVMDLAAQLSDHQVPVMPRFYMRDVTPEVIAREMDAQGGRIAVLTDEASGFFTNASRYNQKGQANWDIYLAGHDGNRFISDRVSRETWDIPHACLPYLLMGQSVVLEAMGRDRQAAGLGLYNRPLFTIPATQVGDRPIKRAAVPPEVKQRWHTLIAALIRQATGVWLNENGEVEMTSPGANDDDDGQYVLTLSRDARADFDGFRQHHERRLGARTGDLAHIADWGSKLPGQVLRLAGILHALRTGRITGGISSATMQAALSLADYCIGHALVGFGRMGAGPGVSDAVHVANWLVGRKRTTVTTRDIHTSTDWDTGRVRAALEFLERYDWVRKQPTMQGRVGRPSEPWAVNPALHGRGAR